MMYYLGSRWRRQALVYFGNSKGSSANVTVVPGAARVCSRAAALKYLVAVNN